MSTMFTGSSYWPASLSVVAWMRSIRDSFIRRVKSWERIQTGDSSSSGRDLIVDHINQSLRQQHMSFTHHL